MIDVKNFIVAKRDTNYAYEMGYDCGINGVNETNCNFGIFSDKENTRAWEKGKRDGEQYLRETRNV